MASFLYGFDVNSSTGAVANIMPSTDMLLQMH